MLTLTVEFLTEKAVATDRRNRRNAEWPPHPSRLFDALAAAYFERVESLTALVPEEQAEKDALIWLESCRRVALSEPDFVSTRTNTSVFVPVNDSTDGSSRIGEGYDLNRSRQERTFPTVVPDPPEIVYCWPDAGAEDVAKHRAALERLAANVTYLGHSSSLIRVTPGTEPVDCTLRPPADNETGEVRLRVPWPGRLEELERQYRLSRETNSRQEPAEFYASFVRVKENGEAVARTIFEERLLVFRPRNNQPLPLTAGLQLAVAVRGALMRLAPQPVSPVICGHEGNADPSRETHLAILPLPFVDHPYADGYLRGFALALPRTLRLSDRREELLAVAQAVESLKAARIVLGRAGEWQLEEVTADNKALRALDPWTWTRTSRRWASVTPIVFGRFPRKRPGNGQWMLHPDTEDCVREMLQQLEIKDDAGNLVRDCDVRVMNASVFQGVPPSHHFPTLSDRGKPIYMEPTGQHREGSAWTPKRQKPEPGQRPRWSAHVLLDFLVPVRGPLTLGAGRYLGLGLCKPYQPQWGST